MFRTQTIAALRSLGRGTPYQVARQIMGREMQHEELDGGKADWDFKNTLELVRVDLRLLFRAGKLDRERSGPRGTNPSYLYWERTPRGFTPMNDDLLRNGLRILDRYAVTLPSPPTLRSVRDALDPFIFDGDHCRDDVAEVCQKLDDVLHEGA